VIGRHISHFYVIRTLGAGGMGVVYEAQDTRLPRSVAVKVLKDDLSKNLDAVRRFKREARLASSLNHPNICTILEVGDDEPPSFIAMELLEGTSLKARLLGGPLSLDEIVNIARQVADALGAAHVQGIIHRDITPGNIFLTAGGLVKLLDFGLAKHFPGAADDLHTTDDITGAGAVAGTIHYMSPEQLAEGEVDHRCDFFSLGTVIYQMATGARPFEILPRAALSAAIQLEPHVPVRQLAPHHPAELERIVDRLLAKRPADRYQSAAALRADLEAVDVGPMRAAAGDRRDGTVAANAPAVDGAGSDPTALVVEIGNRLRRVVGLSPAMQDRIAREIGDAVAAAWARPSSRRQSPEPEAYHAYKRGQHLWKSGFDGGWRPAIDHFQHAIAIDPEFAPAHVALAGAYNSMGFYSVVKPNLAFAVAGRAADRAVAIDPALGPAYIARALSRFGGDWDWDGAEEAFRRGLALDADNALAHVHYSWLLMLLGREDAAFAEARRAHTLAPSSRFVTTAHAQTMYLGGAYDDAIALCSRSLQLDPDYVFAVHLRGLCQLARLERGPAVADLERAAALGRRAPFYLGILGRCYGEFGMRDEALRLVAELEARESDTYVPPQSYVFIYAGLGERDRALEYQEKAYEDGASPFNYLTPCIRALYALSPHHKKRLEQMRLIL